jgi:hypothetical protein
VVSKWESKEEESEGEARWVAFREVVRLGGRWIKCQNCLARTSTESNPKLSPTSRAALHLGPQRVWTLLKTRIEEN